MERVPVSAAESGAGDLLMPETGVWVGEKDVSAFGRSGNLYEVF